MTIQNITLIPTCPTPTVKIGGRVCVSVAVYQGSGNMVLAQFTVLMNAYNAALPEFLTNEDAFNGVDPDGNPTTALGAGKEFIFAQGSPEAPQGVKAITYTP